MLQLGKINDHDICCQVLKTLGSKCIRTSICNVLANHDQNIESRFRLAQSVFICKIGIVIAGFIGLNLQDSIDRKLDSINRISCRFIFLQNFQFSPSPYDVQGFMFYSKYKRKNPNYVLEAFGELCVKSSMRSKSCLPSYTHIELSKSRLMSRT